MKPDHFEELESLLFDWEEGTLNDSGIERVRQILRTDEDARAHYVRYQMMNSAMKLEDAAGLVMPAGSGETMAPNTGPSPSILQTSDNSLNGSQGQAGSARQRTAPWRPRRWMLVVAAIVICVQAGRLFQLEFINPRMQPIAPAENITDTDTRDEAQEPKSQGVALVTRLVDVAWDVDQQPLEVGDALPPGVLAIESGYAQVEFFCGATVILEGPAELDLRSSVLAKVLRGTLRAQVPPAARGFSLEVDDMKVVDLGTEFGLSVSDLGANVQVFDGEVELHQPTSDKRLLTAGEALVRTPTGDYEETEITPDSFLDIATLESRARGQTTARYERWRDWSREIRRDSRLIAYYGFDESGGWERRLQSSLEPSNSELDGAIVGAHRVSGRWPAKSGLEFKRPGDRVKVQIPGEYGSLTFSCWVKIDSLDRWYNSLFLTDNYNLGEPHWQILDTGQLYFSVLPAKREELGPRDFKSRSPSFWKPSLSGRWLHIATVYSVERRSITHYLNGQLLSRDTIPEEQVVSTTRIGTASIGNWSAPTLPDSRFAIRNLNGSMDEFALFAAALSADEIKEIYDNGKP